ncbi:unnamed protein product [Brachionus calyciflorus]|uniref:Cdc6 C-terminal domain-containing protein n=1 Tax=Brachionus calyciflorus TaxID=104777 RepID=A0A814CI94_9BILA|nr:unnamed protein product [Brachionus calyciflorus]
MCSVKEIYSEAKKALNASATDRVVGREKENDEIYDYLASCFGNKNGLSVYINGQPGTGKTFSVNTMLDSLKEEFKFNKIFLNCMSVKNIQNMYKTVLSEMISNKIDSNLAMPKRCTKESLQKLIESCITSIKHHLVLVLDEIDQIETTIKNASDIYKLFELPYLPNSKLILIGIANSLDFTDRLLPRLELTPEHKPKVIKFLPYTKDDIINIVKDRLSKVQLMYDNCVIIDDKALMLCASKIASTNGDIRKVLDICRRAIELNEQEAKLTNLETIKTVNIAQMMKIFNAVNPITNSNLDRNTMPLMQKILLCTILLCNIETKVKEVTLSKLFEKFNKICKSYSTSVDSESEFVNLCILIQDNGLIEVKKAKEVRNYKLSLKIDEQELRDKLQDETFMADILTNRAYK